MANELTLPEPLPPATLAAAASLDALAATTDAGDTSPVGLVAASWREARDAGGDKGGERAVALAQAWAPMAVADLARRALATGGRDADRLWRPILDAAGAIGQGAAQASGAVVNVAQLTVIIAQQVQAQQQQARSPAPVVEGAVTSRSHPRKPKP